MENDNDRVATDYEQEVAPDPSEFDGHMTSSENHALSDGEIISLESKLATQSQVDDQLTNDLLVGENTTKGDVLNMINEEKV